MSIPVIPVLMKHFYNGSLAERLYLRIAAEYSRVYTQEDIAAEAQESTTLTEGDLMLAFRALISRMRKILVRGDRVRIEGLGTFFLTIGSKGVETEAEIDVHNITDLRIRFLPDKALKLVNNATSPVRSTNNVSFHIKTPKEATNTGGNGGNSGGNGGNGGGDIDPNA